MIADAKQSIYWNALQGEAKDRIDFTDLKPDDQQFPYKWMRQLLDEPSTIMRTSPVPSLARKLKHLYYESKRLAKASGVVPLAFGYPMLVLPDFDAASNFSSAPLFIWELHLRPSPELPDDWMISCAADAEVRFNPFLAQQLQSKYDLDLTFLLEDVLSERKVSQLGLLKVCNEIALRLKFDGNNSTTNAVPFPSERELVEIAINNGGLVWSGVIGLFPHTNVRDLAIIDAELATLPLPAPLEANDSDDDTYAINHVNALKDPPSWLEHSYAPIDLDPYQANVLQTLQQHDQVLVTGAAQSNTSDIVSALVTNLLSNRKKTLIVAPTIKSLQSIQNQLDKIGVGEQTFILSNPHHQKKELIEALYQSSLAARKLPQFEEEDYKALLNKLNRVQKKLDAAHDLFTQPIFDGQAWTEVTGRYLESQKVATKHLLNSHLKADDFEYSHPEHEAILQKIERAELLYAELNTMKHPLRVLHSDIFSDYNHENAKSYTFDTLDAMLDDVRGVYEDFVMEQERYGALLQADFDDYYENLKSKVAEVRADISDYQQQYGDDFNKFGFFRNLRMRALGVISKRLTNILDLKKETKNKYNDLEGAFEHQRFFAYSFPRISGTLTFDKVTNNLADFEQSLEEWRAGIPNTIRQEIERLNDENINPTVEFEANIQRLDQAFEKLLTSLNQRKVYQKKFHSDASTLVKKRAYLEEVIEMLESLQYNLRDFDAYYFWTNFWLSLPTNQQSVVKALITTRPKNWTAAFNSWYFHSLLQKCYSTSYLNESSAFDDYDELLKKLQPLISEKALRYWKLKQADEVRRVRRENKFLYNALFGKSHLQFVDKLNIQALFRHEFDLISNMFPVILSLPSEVSDWMSPQKAYFDLAIINYAERIQSEDATGALWRSEKQLIIDNALSTQHLSPSLVAHAVQSNFKTLSLKYLYSDVAPAWQSFVNAAFHNDGARRTLSVAPATTLPNIQIINIEGTFLEPQQINKEEADQVVHLLNQIEADKNGKYPSVGIVCFTKAQFQLIQSYIEQIKQRRVAGNELILQLELSGLQVIYYQDLYDHRFDVVITSAVYGLTVENRLTNAIEALALDEARYGINAALHCAKQKMYWLNSLPNNYIEHFANATKKRQQVANILANWILYARALEYNAPNTQQAILTRLQANATAPITQNKAALTPNTFIKAIAEGLMPYLEEGRLTIQPTRKEMDIDLLIAPIHFGQPAIALQSDGSFWRLPKGAHQWENISSEYIRSEGIDYEAFWSVEFWKAPEIAVKQLAAIIIKHDEHFRPKPPVSIVSDNDEVLIINDDNAVIEIEEGNEGMTDAALELPPATDTNTDNNGEIEERGFKFE